MKRIRPKIMNKSDNVVTDASGAARHYQSFLALAGAILVGLMLVGYLPTRSLTEGEPAPAMIAGCVISLVAALVGTLPVMLAQGRAAAETVPAVLQSILIRLLAVVMLGVAVSFSGWFDVTTLLVWLVIGHAALMVADIRFTKQVLYTA